MPEVFGVFGSDETVFLELTYWEENSWPLITHSLLRVNATSERVNAKPWIGCIDGVNPKRTLVIIIITICCQLVGNARMNKKPVAIVVIEHFE